MFRGLPRHLTYPPTVWLNYTVARDLIGSMTPVFTMAECVKDAVREMPPSAKLVFKVLQTEGELTPQQLAEETYLPPRTVRYALKTLEEGDVIDSRFNFTDARQRLYSLDRSACADPESVSSTSS